MHIPTQELHPGFAAEAGGPLEIGRAAARPGHLRRATTLDTGSTLDEAA